ncbi:ABC transporter permease [Spongisporangium articulatum]|uniref:Transport permease protein n=1 Tax=Spongisporangium articulatum TaxID=3362603 RepID=A0ABW8AS36_9ACTN
MTDLEQTPAATLAARYGLPKLGGRPGVGGYLAQLWDRRHFTLALARSRFRAQNEEYQLGILWVLLLPLINIGVYWLVFGLLVKSRSSTRPDHFLSFLTVGIFTFGFFTGCFVEGAKSIAKNRGLVRTLHFPRAVLPLSVVIQQLMTLGAQLVVMFLVIVVSGEPITYRWLLIIPVYLMMTLFCSGVAFVAARLTVHIRDITQIIPFVNRLLFYTSGIFFVVAERYGKTGPDASTLGKILSQVLTANPLNVYLTLARDALLSQDRHMRGVHATALQWQLGVVYGVVVFVVGFYFFWRAEGLYGRD